MRSGPVTGFLRYLRGMNPDGAIEYVGQLLGGLDTTRSYCVREPLQRTTADPCPGTSSSPVPYGKRPEPSPSTPRRSTSRPWVAQMGFGRGGWYGWNPLDREDTGVFRLLAVASPKSLIPGWTGRAAQRPRERGRSKPWTRRGRSRCIRCATRSPDGNWIRRRSRVCSSTPDGCFISTRSVPARRVSSCQDPYPHESELVRLRAQMDGWWRHGHAAKAARWVSDPSGDRRPGGAEASHIAWPVGRSRRMRTAARSPAADGAGVVLATLWPALCLGLTRIATWTLLRPRVIVSRHQTVNLYNACTASPKN